MLSNVKCLVTGASSGIGKATCQILTREGATVVGTGRNQEALQHMKDEGKIMDYIIGDLTHEGECGRIVRTSWERLQGLTTVVNAAGILRGGAMGDINMENYHTNMICNTQVPFEIMMHAIPYLKQQQQQQQQDQQQEQQESSSSSSKCFPSIVTVSSVNGKQSFPSCISYCMSKAAVDQMTRCASIDLAKYGIRVNAVNPGVIETNLHRAGGMSEEAYTAFLKRSVEVTHPLATSLGRIGEPEEVGELIAFLVSDKAKFITGECIAIDGGRQNLGAR